MANIRTRDARPRSSPKTRSSTRSRPLFDAESSDGERVEDRVFSGDRGSGNESPRRAPLASCGRETAALRPKRALVTVRALLPGPLGSGPFRRCFSTLNWVTMSPWAPGRFACDCAGNIAFVMSPHLRAVVRSRTVRRPRGRHSRRRFPALSAWETPIAAWSTAIELRQDTHHGVNSRDRPSMLHQ